MQNTSRSQCEDRTGQLISLLIVRLEIDDRFETNLENSSDEDKSTLTTKDNLNSYSHIHSLFNYKSPAYLQKTQKLDISQLDNSAAKTTTALSNCTQSFEEFSEKFANKEEALNALIGERKSRPIRIETFELNNNNYQHHNTDTHPVSSFLSFSNSNEPMPQMYNNYQCLVNNAMTMQKALETAYNEWNKEKLAKLEEEEAREKQSIKMCWKEEEEESVNKNIEINFVEEELNKELEKVDVLNEEVANWPKTDVVKNEEVKELKISSSIPYYYGNPSVDLVKGFIHIYKDCDLIKMETPNSQPTANNFGENARSELLCMIGIPTSITCNELLDFVMRSSENDESMEYIRILRDTTSNHYMALLKFKSQKEADFFYCLKNNTLFNSIEENYCHLAFVERVEAIKSSKGASSPIHGFTELPTCYICLERMDESLNGVITILCNHSFHGNCLSKWGEACCPVCRYSQTPDYSADSACMDCGSHENLWICLICGNVGCGRYIQGHAYSHFQKTQHTYSMQLGNSRVWDYAADNYVHRLIQNKADGKPVRYDEGGRMIDQDEKTDSIMLEYTYLLTSQLESQRAYFEEKLSSAEEKSKIQVTDAEKKCDLSEIENSKLKENISTLTKEKNNLEKKISNLATRLNKLQSNLTEEKALNKCLASNQEAYQTKIVSLEESMRKSVQLKDAEIKELQSQLRDIMFYLDAQNKFTDSTMLSKDELDGSHLVIQQENNNNNNNAKSNNSRRKRKN